MIFTLLAIFILIIGIAFLIIYDKWLCWKDSLAIIGVTCVIIGAICSVVFAGMAIGTKVNSDVDYENKLAEKQMIEYRIEQGEEIAGNELLYTQIVEFNNSLRKTKKWSSNPWTSWFYNAKIAELDYIEIKEVNSNEKNNRK